MHWALDIGPQGRWQMISHGYAASGTDRNDAPPNRQVRRSLFWRAYALEQAIEHVLAKSAQGYRPLSMHNGSVPDTPSTGCDNLGRIARKTLACDLGRAAAGTEPARMRRAYGSDGAGRRQSRQPQSGQ